MVWEWLIAAINGALLGSLVVQLVLGWLWLRRLRRMLHVIGRLAEQSLIRSQWPLWRAWAKSMGEYSIQINVRDYRFDYDPAEPPKVAEIIARTRNS